MKNFGIFGGSISYTKSPIIHKLFFNQFNLNYKYLLFECNLNNFNENLFNFLNEKNTFGVNITIPFKELSILNCDILDNSSYLSKSVNTIKKVNNNLLEGFNTDGIGLISDLKRINFINKNFKILLIGAGGAARGIIPEIYKYSSKLILVNRTFDKSNELKLYFNKLGFNNIYVNKINEIDDNDFDLIINSTSSSSKNINLEISNKLINKKVKCYDLFYDLEKDTYFIKWCKLNGSMFCSDGLGMLVYQAAYSFYYWNNIMPNINLVLKNLRK